MINALCVYESGCVDAGQFPAFVDFLSVGEGSSAMNQKRMMFRTGNTATMPSGLQLAS